MNPFAAFVLGLLVGWVVEWVIDWWYWRRKNATSQVEAEASCRRRVAELEREVDSYKHQIASLQAEHDRLLAPAPAPAVESPVLDRQPAEEPPPQRDALDQIKGVTAEIARRLNEAGIFTLAGLAALRPSQLRSIAGDGLERPGSEVEIIKQARLAAGTIKKVDNLEVIVGIGPVIARTLNNAGVFSFAELSHLTVTDLREIVGERIQRLADEDQIISQARQLAEDQDRGG